MYSTVTTTIIDTPNKQITKRYKLSPKAITKRLDIQQSQDELIEDESFIDTYKCIEELKLIQHKFKQFPNRELVLLRNEEETTILIEINNEPNIKYVKANRVPFYRNKVNMFWINIFNTLEEEDKYCKGIHI